MFTNLTYIYEHFFFMGYSFFLFLFYLFFFLHHSYDVHAKANVLIQTYLNQHHAHSGSEEVDGA